MGWKEKVVVQCLANVLTDVNTRSFKSPVVNVSVIMCILVWIHVRVCVAPPIVVGAWPMAGTLWRLFEYYYYVALEEYLCTTNQTEPITSLSSPNRPLQSSQFCKQLHFHVL